MFWNAAPNSFIIILSAVLCSLVKYGYGIWKKWWHTCRRPSTSVPMPGRLHYRTWRQLIYDGVPVAHPACVTQSHAVFKERLAFCLSANRFSAHTTQMLVSGVALGISLETGDSFLSLQMEVQLQQPCCQLRWTPVVIYSRMQARPVSRWFTWTATE